MAKTDKRKKMQRKTRKINRRYNYSMKPTLKRHFSSQSQSHAHIVKTFLEMLNMIKLYHWKTHSFSQHKATDELHSSLSASVDSFVEVLMGKDGTRITMVEKQMTMYDFSNINDFKERIYAYRDFLIGMTDYLHPKKDTDLLNIKDEMLGNINKFLYLLTLQ